MNYVYHFCAKITDKLRGAPNEIDGIINLPEKIITAEALAALRDQLLELAIGAGDAQDGDQVVISSLSFLHQEGGGWAYDAGAVLPSPGDDDD